MLILTRKCNESIAIADNVRVTVLRVEGGQVRLGIEAPRHIAVHRQEVYDKIQKENLEAAKISPVTVGRLARKWQHGKAQSPSPEESERDSEGPGEKTAPPPSVDTNAKVGELAPHAAATAQRAVSPRPEARTG